MKIDHLGIPPRLFAILFAVASFGPAVVFLMLLSTAQGEQELKDEYSRFGLTANARVVGFESESVPQHGKGFSNVYRPIVVVVGDINESRRKVFRHASVPEAEQAAMTGGVVVVSYIPGKNDSTVPVEFPNQLNGLGGFAAQLLVLFGFWVAMLAVAIVCWRKGAAK